MRYAEMPQERSASATDGGSRPKSRRSPGYCPAARRAPSHDEPTPSHQHSVAVASQQCVSGLARVQSLRSRTRFRRMITDDNFNACRLFGHASAKLMPLFIWHAYASRASRSGCEDRGYLRTKCARNSALLRLEPSQPTDLSARISQRNFCCLREQWRRVRLVSLLRRADAHECSICFQTATFMSASCQSRRHCRTMSLQPTDRRATLSLAEAALSFCAAQKMTQLPAKFRVFSCCNRSKEHGWAAD